MVVKKTPKEILGIGFNISGVLMIIVGLLTFGLSVAARVAGEEGIMGLTLPAIAASVALIVIGIIFTVVGFHLQKILVPKRKR
jgi:uncharacterized Tic20 family protein